ncbi:head-tail adaptor [Providencia alcalifaciens]|uniref:Putative phage head-tail adaptor n=1 Tax=Providencia alcalifaciens DSM 30120 TaxID=520999 RepID=B6XBS4_9GAMM|nr:phage head closure protein [Providencia alcalifaciens]ATG18036.1 head-tail adaptor [Providencia alcalifaciens]EEB47076.1 putative phage head-tail adaptor [Providencia alcalifaciens DSM 30120]SQI33556.1 Bacteriophage head-tail adaptor [Providencia alcalifaciens]
MDIGRLRHRVRIERPVTKPLSSGTREKTWMPICETWAEVNSISGRELMSSGAEMSEVTVRVWMRYRADIHPACRMVYRGRIYGIQAVIPDVKFTRLELLCKYGVKDG